MGKPKIVDKLIEKIKINKKCWKNLGFVSVDGRFKTCYTYSVSVFWTFISRQRIIVPK